MFSSFASSGGNGHHSEKNVEQLVATTRAAVRAKPGRRSMNLQADKTTNVTSRDNAWHRRRQTDRQVQIPHTSIHIQAIN